MLVEVAVKVKRFDRHIGSAKVPLEETPEILKAIRVYLSLYISLRVIHNIMYEAIMKQIVANGAVGVDLGTVTYLLKDFALQGFAANVGDYLAANLPQIAVEDALHGSLAR